MFSEFSESFNRGLPVFGLILVNVFKLAGVGQMEKSLFFKPLFSGPLPRLFLQ